VGIAENGVGRTEKEKNGNGKFLEKIHQEVPNKGWGKGLENEAAG